MHFPVVVAGGVNAAVESNRYHGLIATRVSSAKRGRLEKGSSSRDWKRLVPAVGGIFFATLLQAKWISRRSIVPPRIEQAWPRNRITLSRFWIMAPVKNWPAREKPCVLHACEVTREGSFDLLPFRLAEFPRGNEFMSFLLLLPGISIIPLRFEVIALFFSFWVFVLQRGFYSVLCFDVFWDTDFRKSIRISQICVLIFNWQLNVCEGLYF